MRLNTWIKSLHGLNDNQIYALTMRLVLDYMHIDNEESYFHPANHYKGLYWLSKQYKIAYRDLIKQLNVLEKANYLTIKSIGKMKYIELLSKD